MAKTEPQRIAVFIAVFGTIGIAINCARHHSERQQSAAFAAAVNQQQMVAVQSADSQKASADTAAQHAAYVAKYVNAGFTRQPGVQSLAVIVASENGRLNSPMASAIARHFNAGSVSAVSSFFTPEFISDGLFNQVFDGSTEAYTKLDLAHSLDAILLVRQTVSYKQTPSLENLVSANMQLVMMLSSVTTRGQSQSWTFTAFGSGFTQQAARTMAEERLIKQINDDKTMSL